MIFLEKISFTLIALGALSVLVGYHTILKSLLHSIEKFREFLTGPDLLQTVTYYEKQTNGAKNYLKLSALFFSISLILQIYVVANLINSFLK